MLATHFHKLNLNYFQFLKKTPYFQDLNLTQMQKTANQLGVFLAAYFVKWQDFLNQPIKNPLLCQIKQENRLHFVIVYQKTTSQLLVADPQQTKVEWWSLKQFQAVYSGIVLTSEKSVYLPSNTFDNRNHLYFWNKLVFELIISFGISILTTTFVILNQFLVKVIIDEVLIKQIPNILVTILLGFTFLFVIKLILKLVLDVVLDKIEINFKKSWNLKFFAQVSQLSFVNYQKYKTNLLLQNYRYFNEILHFYFPTSFYILENCFLALTSFFVLMVVETSIILPTLFLLVLALISYLLLTPWFRKINQQQITADKKFNQHFLDFCSNYCDYQNRNRIWVPLHHLRNQLNEQILLSQRANTLTNLESGLDQTFLFFTSVVIIYFLVNVNKAQLIKPGSFVFLFALINNLVAKTGWFFRHFTYWTKLKEPKAQVANFLFHQNSSPTTTNPLLWQKIDKLQLQGINYSYNQSDQLWKHSLNLTITNHLVIYGSSGVGKTTLLHILGGNLPRYQGQVLINHKPLSKTDSQQQERVYFLQSSATVLADTVLNNIFMFEQRKDFFTLWKASGIDYFCQQINLHPQDSINNQSISTGQKQVINFLNLFFRNEPIFLLDESLNSVNLELKQALLTKLLKVRPKTLIIYTSHDPQISALFPQRLDLIANDE